MQYDKKSQEFVLTADDRLALGAPTELHRWPMRDADHLFTEAAFAESKINDIDESYFPHSANRAQILAEKQKRTETLKKLREVLAATLVEENAGEILN